MEEQNMRYGQYVAALAVVAMAAGPIWAEESNAEGGARSLELGVKAGANFARLTGDNVDDPAAVTGLTGGVFMSIGKGSVALEPGVFFTAKGYKYTSSVPSNVRAVTDNYNYLEIPVLLKFVINPRGEVRPYIAAGPAWSFLISERTKTDLSASTSTGAVERALPNSEISVVVDAGLAISVGLATVSFDLRHAIGVTDVSRVDGVTARNSVTTILAGLAF
jgi:outer membrane protein W